MVVPFAGSDAQLRELRTTLAGLRLRRGDELIVSDNRRDPVRTPGYARNGGARGAAGEWLVFIDADTLPEADLLDAYFEPPPDPGTGILAGSIRDVALRETRVARSGVANARMSQRTTLERGGTPYAQTANCAIRRDAFEALGGFAESARAGEDADLCFRLQRAGWAIEERPAATAAHRSRETLAAWLAQMVRHGSGAAWLERRWPGELPRAGAAQLACRVGSDAAGAIAHVRRGDGEAAAEAMLDALGASAFELGRLLPNTRGGRLKG